MKILLLYQYSAHNITMDLLCENLHQNGIDADSFNVVSWRFHSINRNRQPILLRILKPFMFIPRIRGLFILLFRQKILLTLSKNYSIIDIHFFSSIYDQLISAFKNDKKMVKVTLWGSDFYRSDLNRREDQRKVYKNVDIIQLATKQMLLDFLNIYPENGSKMRLAHFGNNSFELIEKFQQKIDFEGFKKELKIPNDKIVIVCGLNGSEGHQHELIFDSIYNLEEGIKKQIYLIVPMTYGGNQAYITKLKKKLATLKLSNQIIEKSLSNENLCKLRIVSDIMISIQISDAFSASVQEHIFAGGIVIVGDWLPYEIFKDYDIRYVKTEIENLTNNLNKTILNFTALKEECKKNKEKITALSAWKSSIKDWVSNYSDLEIKEH